MRKVCLLATLLALSARGTLHAQGEPQFPAGFVVEPIGSNWIVPVSLCFIDGTRLLVAEKAGTLWYVENKTKKNVVLALDGEIISSGDRGLIGLAADPQFDVNGYVYLLLVVDPDGDGNDVEQETFTRLVRYTTAYDGSGNLLADPGSRLTLLGPTWSSGIPSLHLSHAAGRLDFMSDGSLVLSHGDGAHWNVTDAGGHDPNGFGPGKFAAVEDIGAYRSLAQGSLAGKVLRLDPATGLGLPDNPLYTGNPDDLASRVWATGLRNPYRFTLVPGTGPREALFVCDVGNLKWEEINLCLGGERFGWPCYEGEPEQPDYQAHDPHGYCDAVAGTVTDPWLAWHHTLPGSLGFVGSAATGACVYTGTSYPPLYQGALFFCDLTGNWMKVATLDAELERTALLSFGSDLDHPIDIEREPVSGDLVYISLGATENRILRLRYAPSNLPPVAVASATPSWGPVPLSVELSAAGSSDPEGDPLDYWWDLGDGTSSASPQVTKVYTGSETYVVVLTVTDDLGNQDTEQLLVNSANTPPTISSVPTPTDGDHYEHGEPVLLECAAVDAEDDLAGIPLQAEWSFDLIHDHHVHPAWASVPGFTGSWTPEDHGDGSHGMRVHLTVTDSRGLSDARSFLLYDHHATPLPHVISISNTSPRLGIPITVRGHVDYLVPPGNPLATLTFEWGDGASDVFTDSEHQLERQATHTYAALGTYTLRVVATEGELTNESTTTIQVERPAPVVAVFVPLLAEGYVGWQEQAGIGAALARIGPQVSVFHWEQQAELVTWMQTYLEDELRDLLVLVDFAPELVFAGEAEGSLAEQWLESGKGIVWTGAPPFAASIAQDGSTDDWGIEAVVGLLDSNAGVCQGIGSEQITPLAKRFLPSLTSTSPAHAVRFDRLGPTWSPVRAFAFGDDVHSDAVELRHASGGLYAQFYCVTGSELPRATVLAQFVRNLLRTKIQYTK